MVWFFAGLAAGFIFFYPPIPFLIGLFGFVRGILTGDILGDWRMRRHAHMVRSKTRGLDDPLVDSH